MQTLLVIAGMSTLYFRYALEEKAVSSKNKVRGFALVTTERSQAIVIAEADAEDLNKELIADLNAHLRTFSDTVTTSVTDTSLTSSIHLNVRWCGR